MQVAFHVGVPGSDDNRVNMVLGLNRDVLSARHIELSARETNEPILNEALAALKGGTASPEMEAVVLDALLEGDQVSRLIMSRPSFVGLPRKAVDRSGILAGAGPRLRALAGIFPSADSTFFMAIKNPATFVPGILALGTREPGEIEALADADVMRWAPCVRRILEVIAPRRLVVWCHEDAPMVFPEVLRAIAGIEPGQPLRGENAMAEGVLTAGGISRLRERLAVERPASIAERRALTAEILREHHDPAAIRQTLTLPGLTQGLVDRMTRLYDIDTAEIAALSGVEFIAP